MKVKLTQHVVERYQERVRHVSPEQARHDLEQLVAIAEEVQEPPSWAVRVRHDADCYLVLADVALVMKNGYALTLLTPGSLPPQQRRARNLRRTKRRARKRRVGGM